MHYTKNTVTLQVNTNLLAEVAQLKSSKTQLSSELAGLKDKYLNLNQDFEKSTFINEAEEMMDQLDKILADTKLNFNKLPFFKKQKVHLFSYKHMSPLILYEGFYISAHISCIQC